LPGKVLEGVEEEGVGSVGAGGGEEGRVIGAKEEEEGREVEGKTLKCKDHKMRSSS